MINGIPQRVGGARDLFQGLICASTCIYMYIWFVAKIQVTGNDIKPIL